MLIELVTVFIPVELNPIGLTKIKPVIRSLDTFTAVDVPIPTDNLGLTVKSIWSLSFKLWEVDTLTTTVLFSTSHFTLSKSVSNKNLSLSPFVYPVK